MAAKLLLISLSISVVVQKGNSNIFFGDISPPSSGLVKCTAICDETYPLASNNVGRIDSCSRGCRFYGIAELVGTNKQAQLNISRDACHNCCFESYEDSNDKAACNMGCDTMAKQQHEVTNLGSSSEISWSIFIEDGDSTQILQTGEMLEPDDVLTDLGLRRQLVLDLVDDTKLPEMRVKTLPVNVDEKILEEETRGDWWTDCTVRRAGLPRCFAASVLILLVLLALWLGLTCDEKSTLPPSPPIIYDPEQAPPLPPKYSLLENEKV